MNRIHDKTERWPALLGVDYAGRGGINVNPSNRTAIEYWRQGGWVTVSTHLYNPANPNGGGLRFKYPAGRKLVHALALDSGT
jgi:Glycosyl hydrolase family 26